MGQFCFSSILPNSYQGDLEQLLFFNPQQNKFTAEIVQSVETYGCPKIVQDAAQLRVEVGALGVVQSLFAFESDRSDAALLGVTLYFRESVTQLTVLHIAVQGQYAATGAYADQCLTVQLLQQVREVAAHIKGVTAVALLYGDSRLRKIPVHHAVRQPALSH